MAYKQRPYRITDGGTFATTAAGARTNLSVPAIADVLLRDGSQAATNNIDFGTFRGVNAADPISNQDLATKAYVDAAAQGLDPKPSVKAISTSNITLSGTQTVDGVALIAGNRILVAGQTLGETNGIYVVAAGVWSRSADADTSAEVTSGLFVFVEQGTTYAASGWVLTTPDPIVLGTTGLTFTQFSGAGQITAGAGLTKTGNTIDAVGTANRIQVNANNIDISSSYIGQTSITTAGTITVGTWQGTKIDIPYGGTNATTASGARSNLATAPNTASYWLGGANGELGSGIIPSAGTGTVVVASTGVISVDTTVVATTGNTLTMSNKTLTSPIINTPKIVHTISPQTAGYTLVLTDDIVLFNISSGAAATLPTAASASGLRYTIKNKTTSSANLTATGNGSETIDGSNTYVLIPGDSIDVVSDGTAWHVI